MGTTEQGFSIPCGWAWSIDYGKLVVARLQER
jgi:hypothetical protein